MIINESLKTKIVSFRERLRANQIQPGKADLVALYNAFCELCESIQASESVTDPVPAPEPEPTPEPEPVTEPAGTNLDKEADLFTGDEDKD